MTEIENYVTTRYDRWLDYASYHCAKAGIPDEAIDMLNEVMLMLLVKPHQDLEKLYQARKGQYRELDFFVLRMIKINATSMTAPYRYKNKPILADANTDYTKLEIIDEPDSEIDRAALTLRYMHVVRFIFDRLKLSKFDRAVFEYRFFQDGQFSNWSKTGTKKDLYDSYNYTRAIIQHIVCAIGIGRPVKLPTNITDSKDMERRISEASRQFMEKIDKRLLDRIKNIEFMEDEEFEDLENEELENENPEGEESENDEVGYNDDHLTSDDYRKAFNGDSYREVGCIDLDDDPLTAGYKPGPGAIDLGMNK